MYSFKQWCLDNNRDDLLNRWDYDLNNLMPSEVSYKSNKKYWFKCPKCIHDSELQNIQYFSSGKQTEMICKKCKSFAQHYIDKFGHENFQKLNNLNSEIDLWDLSYKLSKKINVFCDKEHIYKQTCYHFMNDVGCPYCSNQKILKENSLGYKYKNIVSIWSEKNKKTPFEYTPNSGAEVWWKCENEIHDEYKRSIAYSNIKNFRCPKCSYASAGQKIFQDLIGNKYGRLTVIKLDKERMENENNYKTYWLCKCDCGNEKLVSVYANSLKKGRIISCGCYHLEKISGENSHYWKGGITPEHIKIRNSLDYKKWQQNIFAKDYYTCQCCGKYNNIEKHAHHILNFSDHENIRFNINNGITLCKECHYSTIKGSFHNIYGTSNNTPEQLEEYINNKRKALGIDIPFSINLYLSGNCLKPDNVA